LALATTALVAQPIQRQFSLAVPQYVQGEVLIQYKQHMTHEAAASYTAQSAGGLVKALSFQPQGKGPLHLARTRPGMTVDQAIAYMSQDPNIEYVQPNYIYHALAAPNDPLYSQYWGLKNTAQTISSSVYATNNPGSSGKDIDAETAWNTITDCTVASGGGANSGPIVAVIDTGVNYNHEDLSGSMVSGSYTCPGGTGSVGCDFVGTGDADPLDLNGHGTHVAGTIGAVGNNSLGGTGVCWKARILAVRVLNAAGSGTTADIVEGVNFAAATGAGNGNAKVINMSLGGPTYDATFSTALDTAATNDVVVVVAAGNSNQDHNVTASYPCDYTQANIICVAAADQAYARASFSDYDSNVTANSRKVDIAAPGTNIRSSFITQTFITDDYSSGWTTSPSNTWSFANCNFPPVTPIMANPGSGVGTTWCGGGTVGNSRDDRVYKTFDLSSMSTYDYVTYKFAFWADVSQAGDIFTNNYKSGGGDPFSAGTTSLTVAGSTHTGQFYSWTTDITAGCLTSTCSIGFRLVTDTNANTTYDGVALTGLTIEGHKVTNTTYALENGTSMATPHVAGIATLIRARNPNYTYADTVNAILNGGDAASAFTNNTKSGKVADANGALKWIPDPSTFTVSSP
ncbi:MAG: S8 family serine peptidase, partial [Spirochaetia bacterium]|nr:S8 family serine peptidase [Spirochaetia bacterium]